MLLGWENLRRFLFILLLFFMYHLSMFFILLVLYLYLISRLLCHVTSTPPWLLRPVKVWAELSWAKPRLLSIAFSFSSTASATVLSGHFLPTSVFYLTLLPDIFGIFPAFWHNPLLSRFHWKPTATFLKVAALHTDPGNTDQAALLLWFTVIHNILYILSLHRCMSILQKFYLW